MNKKLKTWQTIFFIGAGLGFMAIIRGIDELDVRIAMGVITAICGFGSVIILFVEWKESKKDWKTYWFSKQKEKEVKK